MTSPSRQAFLVPDNTDPLVAEFEALEQLVAAREAENRRRQHQAFCPHADVVEIFVATQVTPAYRFCQNCGARQ